MTGLQALHAEAYAAQHPPVPAATFDRDLALVVREVLLGGDRAEYAALLLHDLREDRPEAWAALLDLAAHRYALGFCKDVRLHDPRLPWITDAVDCSRVHRNYYTPSPVVGHRPESYVMRAWLWACAVVLDRF